MKKLFQIALMFVFAAFCSCSSDSEETVIYRIYFSEATEGFMGSTDSEAYSVYSSIKSGIVEFEKKYFVLQSRFLLIVGETCNNFYYFVKILKISKVN